MSTAQLDDDLRRLFADYAERLEVPDPPVGPSLDPASADESPPPRRVLWLAAAVALAATVAASAWAFDLGRVRIETGPTDTSSPTTTPSPDPTAPPVTEDEAAELRFVFETPTVALAADHIEVETAGRTFVPNDTVTVSSDPGTRNRYTTLELTWFEDDIEMRIYMYFAGSGSDWWVSEIRTYDGEAQGEWITVEEQHFLRPLGSAFEGDVTVGPLTMQGLRLEGFRRPSACAAAPQFAIQPDTEVIALPAGARLADLGDSAGYGFGVTVYDTTTCEPVPPDRTDVGFEIRDRSVATLVSSEVWHDGEGVRIDLRFVGPGTTTLVVEARDVETGEIWHTIEVPVILE